MNRMLDGIGYKKMFLFLSVEVVSHSFLIIDPPEPDAPNQAPPGLPIDTYFGVLFVVAILFGLVYFKKNMLSKFNK